MTSQFYSRHSHRDVNIKDRKQKVFHTMNDFEEWLLLREISWNTKSILKFAFIVAKKSPLRNIPINS